MDTPSLYHYMSGEIIKGPVSAAELRQLAKFDVLKPDDQVRKVGSDEWRLARNLKGLFAGTQAAETTAATDPPASSKSGTGEEFAAAASVVLNHSKAAAGRVVDRVSRFGSQVDNFSAKLFIDEAAADDTPAIFTREKYFGGCVQRGIPQATLKSLASTILGVAFGWLYFLPLLNFMGAAWQFLPFRRPEYLAVRLRRRVRPSAVLPIFISWFVQGAVVGLVLVFVIALAGGIAAWMKNAMLAALVALVCLSLATFAHGFCNFSALKALRKLNPDTLFDFQASLEYGYPKKVALIRGISSASMEQQLQGVLTLCEQLCDVELGRWDQVTAHGKEGMVAGLWAKLQNVGQ